MCEWVHQIGLEAQALDRVEEVDELLVDRQLAVPVPVELHDVVPHEHLVPRTAPRASGEDKEEHGWRGERTDGGGHPARKKVGGGGEEERESVPSNQNGANLCACAPCQDPSSPYTSIIYLSIAVVAASHLALK